MTEEKITQEGQGKNISHLITRERVEDLGGNKQAIRKLCNAVTIYANKNKSLITPFKSHFRPLFDAKKRKVVGEMFFGFALTAVLLEKEGFSVENIDKKTIKKILKEKFTQSASLNLINAIEIMGNGAIPKCNISNMKEGAAVFLKYCESIQI